MAHMTDDDGSFPPVDSILDGPYWPERVRVIRVEPSGSTRVRVDAVTLNEQPRLYSQVLRRADLANVTVEVSGEQRTLDGDPLGFKLAAEALRIRLAHTYDP